MQLYIVYSYLETALHVSGGISTHYQERTQMCLQYLALVKPLLLPAVFVEELARHTGYADSLRAGANSIHEK